LRRNSGSLERRIPTTRRPQQPTPNATTIRSGPRSSEPLVAVAEIESGSIAIASIMPSETIESTIASSPTRTPPSLRKTLPAALSA
jgi:hypothetical protein